MIDTEVRRRADGDLDSAGPSAVAGPRDRVPAVTRVVHAFRLWLARALS